MDTPDTSQLPFVSAVCITGKSKYHVEKLLPMAIRSFKEQTYPADRRELLLISDGFDAVLPKWISEEPPQIRVSYVEHGASLGALRNRGIQTTEDAQRTLVIQWDDDDWHHPRRIAQQVEAFMSSGGLPVFLQRQLCYDVQRDVAFVREFPNTFIHGTILHANTPDLKPYPEGGQEEAVIRGRKISTEDTTFLQQWQKGHVINNPPELYVRFFHGDEHNPWDRAHVMREAAEYRPRTWAISQQQAEYLEEVLSHYEFRKQMSTVIPAGEKPLEPEDYPIVKVPQRPPPPPVLPPVHVPPLTSEDIPVLTADGSPDRGVVRQGRQDGPAVVPGAEDDDGHQHCGGEKQRSPFVVS